MMSELRKASRNEIIYEDITVEGEFGGQVMMVVAFVLEDVRVGRQYFVQSYGNISRFPMKIVDGVEIMSYRKTTAKDAVLAIMLAVYDIVQSGWCCPNTIDHKPANTPPIGELTPYKFTDWYFDDMMWWAKNALYTKDGGYG